jgi:hypothetical protein
MTDNHSSAGSEQPRGMEPILNSLMQATLDVTTTSRPALRKRFEEILRGQVRDAAQQPGMREALEQIEAIADRPISGTSLQTKANRFDQIKAKARAALAAQPPAAPVETLDALVEKITPENLHQEFGLECSSAGTSDAVKAAQAVELANKIDLHLTLSGSSPGFHLSEDELQMAAAALRYAAMPREPQEAVKREVAKVYVVAQNDFPAAVFDSQEGAEQFVSRQPTKTISKTPIYWRVHMFTLDTLAVTRPQCGGTK